MSDSLELELFVESDPTAIYFESLLVHSPSEIPLTLDAEFFQFDGGKHLEILIKPVVIRSDESLKTLVPSDRSCYFEGERELQFFKVYTQKNCETDRFSNILRAACNCVPFNFPRGNDTKVCGIAKVDKSCVFGFEQDFRNSKPIKFSGQDDSSCLPSCDSVSYDIEIRESRLQGHE